MRRALSAWTALLALATSAAAVAAAAPAPAPGVPADPLGAAAVALGQVLAELRLVPRTPDQSDRIAELHREVARDLAAVLAAAGLEPRQFVSLLDAGSLNCESGPAGAPLHEALPAPRR